MPSYTKLLLFFFICFQVVVVNAQVSPSKSQIASFSDFLAASHLGNLVEVKSFLSKEVDIEQVDSAKRTALHIAAFASHENIVIELAKAGANMNALEEQSYDIVTIASVANDIEMLKVALENGASAKNITSPYDGTALIAAAHLGHHEVVKMLIQAKAPLDHVNNLGWTALIEAVVLGDGGENHLKTVEHLINAGANTEITDRRGNTPLDLAKSYGFDALAQMIEGQSRFQSN